MTNMQASAFAVTLVSAMLLAVAGVGIGTNRGVTPPSSVLDYWRPSEADLGELTQLTAGRLAALPATETTEALVRGLMRHNQAVAGLDNAEYKQGLLLLERELAALARKFLDTHGAEPYLAVGGYLAEQLHTALVELAVAQYGSGLLLQDWLQQHPDDDALKRVRALSGRFLERAMNAGLIGHQHPPDRDRLLVARTLWLERWAILAGLLPEAVLSPVETRLTLLWKIEASEHLSLARRGQLLEVASTRLPDYPASYVEGVLRVRQGDTEEALEAFSSCLEEGVEAERARAWVLSLRSFSWDQLL